MAVEAYPVFVATDATALEGGQVFLGVVNADPEQSPIPVFWDEDLTIPATQPLRTSGGVIVRDGAPANVFASSSVYSIRVRDRAGKVVWYKASAGGDVPSTRLNFPIAGGPPGDQGEPGPADNTYTTLAELFASDPTRKSARLVPSPGETAPAGNFSYIDGAWVRQSADGITIKAPLPFARTRTVNEKGVEVVSVADFDGASLQQRLQNALDATAKVQRPLELAVPEPCVLTSPLTIDRAVDQTLGQFVIKGRGPGAGFRLDGPGAMFTSSLPYGNFAGAGGNQKAPSSEYVTFRDLLFESTVPTREDYVITDKFLRIRFDQCEFRRIKCLKEADYVQTIYFNGCHVRGWSGTFFSASDGYDVQVDGGTMFEAGQGAGFKFTGSVTRFAWFGGIYEGCQGTAVSISGVNGLTVHGVYFEYNGASEIVLGSLFGVSRGISIMGCSFNQGVQRFPIILGLSRAVHISGNQSNGWLADNTATYPFQIAPCVNHVEATGTGFAVDPVNDFGATATPAPMNTQINARPIRAVVTTFTTVATDSAATVMPPLATYFGEMPITIINLGDQNLKVFPAIGESFRGSATDASLLIPSGSIYTFFRSNADYWIVRA